MKKKIQINWKKQEMENKKYINNWYLEKYANELEKEKYWSG